MTYTNISLTTGRKSASGNETIRSGGTIKIDGTTGGGGVRASTSTWGPLPTFNLVVEFFCELGQNYQGVKVENFQSL
jgi:hypothetical protein